MAWRSLFKTAVHIFLFWVHIHCPVFLVGADNFEDEFFDACAEGDVELVKKTLKVTPKAANRKTEHGETCLHLSAIRGSFEITEALLENGADPNARTTSELGLRMTPLSWHVHGGHYEIVRLLLDYGANINDDIDSMYGSETKFTVLDLAETLLNSMKQQPEVDISNAQITYDLLTDKGGMKYLDLVYDGGKDEF